MLAEVLSLLELETVRESSVLGDLGLNKEIRFRIIYFLWGRNKVFPVNLSMMLSVQDFCRLYIYALNFGPLNFGPSIFRRLRLYLAPF